MDIPQNMVMRGFDPSPYQSLSTIITYNDYIGGCLKKRYPIPSTDFPERSLKIAIAIIYPMFKQIEISQLVINPMNYPNYIILVDEYINIVC
jgi:hypothetical protein